MPKIQGDLRRFGWLFDLSTNVSLAQISAKRVCRVDSVFRVHKVKSEFVRRKVYEQ
jgi:hypothetical protein